MPAHCRATRDKSYFCDGNCEKAFGKSNRPMLEKEGVYVPDANMGIAPDEMESPFFGKKPDIGEEKMNTWCLNECERCAAVFANVAEGPYFGRQDG